MQNASTKESAEENLSLKFIDGIDNFGATANELLNKNLIGAQGQVERHSLKSLLYNEDWVYIAVDAIAQPLSSVPWMVYRKVRNGDEISYKKNEAHPLNKLLEDPSKTVDATSFKYMLFSEDALMGNALVYYARTLNEMHVIPAENANYNFTSTGGYPAFIQVNGTNINQSSIQLPTTDIIHIQRPQTSDKYWGLSPFIPSSRSVKFQSYSADYLNGFYQRGATPQGMLKLEKESNPEAVSRMLRKFESAYTGRVNSRRTMLLPKGVEYIPLDTKIADQQLLELINMNRENILNALHIPKHVVSLNSAGSLGSEEFKTALKYFWNATLIPISERFAGKLTRFFAKELGPDNVIGFDLTNIEILQEDKLHQALLSKELMNVMTVNEIRKSIFQLPPVQGGDVIVSLQPKAPTAAVAPPQPVDAKPAIGETQTDQPPQLPPAQNPGGADPALDVPLQLNAEEIVVNAKYFAHRKNLIKAHDAILDSEEQAKTKKYVPIAERMLDAQFDAAEKAFLKTMKQKAFEFDKEKFAKEFEALIKELGNQYAEGHSEELKATMNLAYLGQLSAIFNQENKNAITALRLEKVEGRRSILKDRGLEFFKSTSDTTRDAAIKKAGQILDTLASGLGEKKTIQEMARDIRQYLDETKANRAMTIARTEVLTAVALGQQAMQQDASDVIPGLKKMWRCAMDLRVRGNPDGYYKKGADHWTVHGQVVRVGEKYKNGLMYPHDPAGGAGNTVNCRCKEIPIDPDDEQFLDAPGLPDVAEQTERTKPIPRA